jgi:hypoxanthine phosphoribosyltransferase
VAIVAITGEPGCRHEEAAAAIARELRFAFLSGEKLRALLKEEFCLAEIPEVAWIAAAASVVASLATRDHLVLAAPLADRIAAGHPALLRVHLAAGLNRRIGNWMLDHGLDRPHAKAALAELDAAAKDLRRRLVGRSGHRQDDHDLVCNVGRLDPHQIASIVKAAAASMHLSDAGLLSQGAEAQMQFRYRLQLAKHGIAPAGKASLTTQSFGHPSEEIFANLLDFYRIRWEYEPRSFPLQWDKDGAVTEAFTPDFYLPEFDLYVELTTMKQALVTRKNRKVKLLRAIYPHINIQVFYQKDLQDLVFKYGLSEKVTAG